MLQGPAAVSGAVLDRTAEGALPRAGGADRLWLLAFANDPRTEQILREVVLGATSDRAEVRRGDIAAATRLLGQAPTPAVLIVDIGGVEQPLAALDDLARVCEPDVKVLVIGDREEVDFYRDLTRTLGVTEYLPKPLTRELVASHFLPHVTERKRNVPAQRGGRVVMVTGARGGVGASTIAANLAVHLAADGRRHVALLDLDLHRGSIALLLGTQPSAGLRTALEAPEAIDQLFLDRISEPHGDRLRIFAAEEPVAAPLSPRPDAVRRLLELLRERFNQIVVDAPSGYAPMLQAVLDHTHQRVLVMAPDLANVRDLLRFHALPAAPVQTSRALVVANQCGRPGALSAKALAKALGFAPDIAVPHLPRQVSAAATLGVPALDRARPFRDAIRALADEIVPGRPAAAPRGLISRLIRR
jgi:pilus assembly protein CpaE